MSASTTCCRAHRRGDHRPDDARTERGRFRRQMRARPELASVPVITLSAKIYDADKQAALAAGASAYATKPIRMGKLNALIQKIVANEFQIEFWGVRGTPRLPRPKTYGTGETPPARSCASPVTVSPPRRRHRNPSPGNEPAQDAAGSARRRHLHHPPALGPHQRGRSSRRCSSRGTGSRSWACAVGHTMKELVAAHVLPHHATEFGPISRTGTSSRAPSNDGDQGRGHDADAPWRVPRLPL